MIQNKTEKFIDKANKLHNNFYDYKKTIYVKNNEKVTITCPEHGDFLQTPGNHTHKTQPRGCPECAKIRIASNNTTSIINIKQMIYDIHGDKYVYPYIDKEYKTMASKITIICKEHGEFQQTMTHHITRKQQCNRCSNKEVGVKSRGNTNDFINEANTLHNSFYDYSKTIYVKGTEKVIITCPEHGDFLQSPSNHINKNQPRGCPECGLSKMIVSQTKNTEQFIYESKIIHQNYYTYGNAEYIGAEKKLIITCPKHGDFEQTPANHLIGSGCPRCNVSMGVNYVKIYTENKELGEETGLLYQLKIYNDKENFYKVGITRHDINHRYRNSISKAGYKYEIIDEIYMSNLEAALIEKQIHSNPLLEKYEPNNRFRGHTECYLNRINLSKYIV